jgi:hypothetical protein
MVKASHTSEICSTLTKPELCVHNVLITARKAQQAEVTLGGRKMN